MKATAQEIADVLKASSLLGDASVELEGVFTDTRSPKEGALFVALSGENFDGNRFAKTALEHGAKAVLVSKWSGSTVAPGIAVIEVKDTLSALQRLAYWWRGQLDIPVVCVTGSNGKTSTKDFTRSVLSQKFNVQATSGNLNNHIGLPLTVLSTTKQHTAAIYEIGMNHAGELRPLCEIARPQYGIITNIGTAHIEFLGSRDAIAEEKATLARTLPSDGLFFCPASCDYAEYFRDRTTAPMIPVGNGRGKVRAENIRPEADGTHIDLVIEGEATLPAFIPVMGRHMVTNALLAAATGWKLGLSPKEIVAGLASVNLTSGRMRCLTSGGRTLLDDSYNANPESMEAGLQTLAEMALAENKQAVAVLGAMGELGDIAADAHLELGRLAAEKNIKFIAVGSGAELIAQGGRGKHLNEISEATEWLHRETSSNDIILFKGSRTAAIERVLQSAFPDAC